jgi:hypothetical protein
MVSQQPLEPPAWWWSKGRMLQLWRPRPLIAHCPKKNKSFPSKHDSGKRKDKHEYTFGKHKSKEGFDKEVLKKKYFKKAKAQECAFLASLSDVDNNIDNDCSSFSSSDDESERKCED